MRVSSHSYKEYSQKIVFRMRGFPSTFSPVSVKVPSQKTFVTISKTHPSFFWKRSMPNCSLRRTLPSLQMIRTQIQAAPLLPLRPLTLPLRTERSAEGSEDPFITKNDIINSQSINLKNNNSLKLSCLVRQRLDDLIVELEPSFPPR